MSDWSQRLEDAIQQAEPFQAAHTLALECRHGGMPQPQLLELFESVRVKHESDPDGAAYNALLDVMDYITGWCAPHNRLYPG